MKFGMFFIGEYLGVTLVSCHDRDAVLRRLAGSGFSCRRDMVCDQNVCFYIAVHPAAGVYAAAHGMTS